MPCADMEVNSAAHTKPEFASNNDEHSHDKQNDLCSPFCACNCCNVSLTYFPVTTINFPITTEIIKLPLPTYKSILSSNFYGSIWQPPQIA
ncbi:hypothetical protein KZH69_08740 [Flavobacterium sp. NAS39]|uniref:Uncharacterized protein n=1 Tax=Flavobacterium taihuense TaxID=2857508 RepID=A0ABS6XV67_9FLAO|nr:hypothetical protein [Flavobacterium taihuense]